MCKPDFAFLRGPLPMSSLLLLLLAPTTPGAKLSLCCAHLGPWFLSQALDCHSQGCFTLPCLLSSPLEFHTVWPHDNFPGLGMDSHLG